MKAQNSQSRPLLSKQAKLGIYAYQILSFFIGTIYLPLAGAAPFVVPNDVPMKVKMKVVVADVPELFHWTSIDSLERLAKAAKNSKFPFEKVIDPNTMISRSFPQLSGIKGIFNWINPIGGMGASANEMYEPEKDDALIRFSMKKNLRILMLDSQDGGAPITNLDLSGVDVIFHLREWSFHEFIIINPDAIVAFTSDPDVVRLELEKAISLFEQNDWTNSNRAEGLVVTEDLYNSFGKISPDFTSTILPRVKAFLDNRKGIPDFFKGSQASLCLNMFQ